MVKTSRPSHSHSSRPYSSRRHATKKSPGDEPLYKSFALRVVAALVLMLLVTLGVIATNMGNSNQPTSTAYTD